MRFVAARPARGKGGGDEVRRCLYEPKIPGELRGCFEPRVQGLVCQYPKVLCPREARTNRTCAPLREGGVRFRRNLRATHRYGTPRVQHSGSWREKSPNVFRPVVLYMLRVTQGRGNNQSCLDWGRRQPQGRSPSKLQPIQLPRWTPETSPSCRYYSEQGSSRRLQTLLTTWS